MPEYLSKEEVRQWRSSLEKITLEEFARRLGKVINDDKPTNDVVDKVMQDISFSANTVKEEYQTRAEKINIIAQEAILREREIVNNYKPQVKTKAKPVEKVAEVVQPKEEKQEVVKKAENIEKTVEIKTEKEIKPAKKVAKTTVKPKVTKVDLDSDFPVVLKKAFTAREQVVFEHLLANKGTVVYARDLAELLGLPRDYIYKYIKGIRAKVQQDVLSNAEKGGFVLNV